MCQIDLIFGLVSFSIWNEDIVGGDLAISKKWPWISNFEFCSAYLSSRRILMILKLVDLTGNDPSIRRKPGTSEAFQRHPEGKGIKPATGLRRYDVKRFF
jgi:hypothetical protein